MIEERPRRGLRWSWDAASNTKDQYSYKPEGVKLDDARAILFWYKPEGPQVPGRLRRPAHRRRGAEELPKK